MLSLIAAAVLSTGIYPWAVECSDSQHAWSWKAHDGTCRSIDADDPAYRIAPVISIQPCGQPTSCVTFGNHAVPQSVTQSADDDWKRTMRACYDIGRMTDIMVQAGADKTEDGHARIAQGRAACFMEDK